jgi:hypothetical protein
MRSSEKVKLLGGPYRAPALRRGQLTFCRYRRCKVVVTGWTDARIPWPLCKPWKGYGRPGILVDEKLARAIGTESAAALMHWWGVGAHQVWKWRKSFGIGRADTPGSARLVRAAAQKGANAEKHLSEEERERRRRQAKQQNKDGSLRGGYRGPLWTAEELALLGTMPDSDRAKQIGRTEKAVMRQRLRRKIAPAKDRRRKET